MTIDPSDDDRLREALRRNAPPPEADTVLRQLQPAMRRSRSHRRIAKGTATALLVLSGGAAVLAVNASLPGPERRASTVLPSVTDRNADESTSTAVTIDRLVPAPPSPDSPDDPTSSIQSQTTSREGGILGTETTRTSPSVTQPPAPGAAVTQPAGPTAAPTTQPEPIDVVTVAPATIAPPSPPPPASSSTSTVSSECGLVVIGMEGQRIHVDSIAPSPGFTSQVSTDGPETVELVLVSSPKKCEIHVESKVDGLHVEVQDGS